VRNACFYVAELHRKEATASCGTTTNIFKNEEMKLPHGGRFSFLRQKRGVLLLQNVTQQSLLRATYRLYHNY
jgi:hypothetical protein